MTPPSFRRFQAPDWLFRLVFGPGAVAALLAFGWLISRNQPLPLPTRTELGMNEQLQTLWRTANIAPPVSCKYWAKTYALFTCILRPGTSIPISTALRQQSWTPHAEDPSIGTGQYIQGKQKIIIYCLATRIDCMLDFKREW